VEWKSNATGDENFMGDWGDLPIDLCGEKEMQQSRLQKKREWVNYFDEVIEEIRKLMLDSAHSEVNNKRRLNRG